MWRTCEHVSRPWIWVVLDLSLTSFHSVAVGFAILCFQRRILVNLNASTVAYIEIWGNCHCLFYMLTNTTLNRLGFATLTVGTTIFHWLYFDCIWLVPVAADSSVFIWVNIVWNRWKSTLKPRSIRVNLNQGYCLLCSRGEVLESHGVCLR